MTRNDEAIAEAAEHILEVMPSCAQCLKGGQCKYCKDDATKYALAAMIGYESVMYPDINEVEELDALPVGTVVLAHESGPYEAGKATHDVMIWGQPGDTTGYWSKDVPLPARVLRWGD